MLLEPRAKRWAFLREAARAAEVAPRVEVSRTRHDTYGGAPAETVTLRALALPLSSLARLVVPGGRLLVFGPRPAAGGPFEAESLETPPGLHSFRRTG